MENMIRVFPIRESFLLTNHKFLGREYTMALKLRIVRRRRNRRRYVGKSSALRRKYAMRRKVLNPKPTFVETFKSGDPITLFPGQGVGKAFKVRITDIPQINNYYNLYTQYRINWFKVMLIPKLNTGNSEPNMANYNSSHADASGSLTPGYWAQTRIVSAIQDSPNEQDPANELAVLNMNGCKIRTLKSMWSQSCRPVPDTSVGGGGANPVYAIQRYRQFFNFDETTSGNNPLHGAVVAYISTLGNHNANTLEQVYEVFYKVNFTLRDPK